jgi:hypothetical protein
MQSDFGNGDGAFGANFNTGLATQTFVGVDRLGLAALHFKNLSGASVYTLFITRTFIFVNNDFPHGTTSKMNELRTQKTMLLQPWATRQNNTQESFSFKRQPMLCQVKRYFHTQASTRQRAANLPISPVHAAPTNHRAYHQRHAFFDLLLPETKVRR